MIERILGAEKSSGDFIFDYAMRNKERARGKTRDEIVDMFVEDLCEIGRKMEEEEIMGWICVRDRVPEETGQYLCIEYNNGRECTIRTFLKPNKCFTYIGEDHLRHIADNVTHWAPLPEPPED